MGNGISGATRLLTLMADPVVQARSPAMANAALARRGRYGEFVLLPMQVPAGAFEDAIAGLRRIANFGGAIVSMPHKTTAASIVDDLMPEACLVGAVNVIRREDDGRLVGTILDGEGFVSGLLHAGHAVTGKSFLLAGAGGAASAVAVSLARHACGSLHLVNRTAASAEQLAAKVAGAFPHVKVTTGPAFADGYDVAVNGTSVGMKDGDGLPLPADVVRSCKVVAECVISPERTPLLEFAENQGCKVHTGVAMLAEQMELMLDFMGVPRGPRAAIPPDAAAR